ncbi:FAD binding domain-containing protein [Viridothelium virens]|uniref:FAD binding domain-containing protein n=1 Tax=Viridothelium virens TaxID=1048519 RepID=A0A6A6H4Q9_VIRVR|nr:FAD binding domain-containing protein [Viridothelium virens]
MLYISTIAGLLVIGVLPLCSLAASNVTVTTKNATGFPPCDALIQAGLGNRLLFATDPDYEPRIASWWALNTRLHPWCLFQPQNTAEVSTSMNALLGAGDGAGDWHIAVRAGGHNTGRTNNVDNGVTIDLGNMNRTTYDSQSNLASIGPGSKWKDVYAELHKHGVLVPGGRDGGVGVGGFLLGGGLTYYVGREAFACDSVKNFEIVLTNGTVVNANKDENSDLWMALKGGGSNFGIVTRYDMEALPDKELAYGIRIMSADYSSDLVDAIVHFTDNYQGFDSDALVAYLSHNTSIIASDVIMAAIHVNTEGVQNTTGFTKLNQIPSLVPDETLSVSLAQAAEGSQLPSGSWNAGATLTFKNDKRILNRAVQLHGQYVQDLKNALGADNFVTYVFFQPLPTFLGEISNQKGGNMLGIDLQEHNAIMWTGGVAVKTDQQALAFAQTRLNAMLAELRSFSASLSGGNRLIYLNYADSSQDPLGSYVKKNVDHIKAVAAKYDPKGAFQKRFPGGFKISRVDD